MTGHGIAALFAEARKVFGPDPSQWNRHEVGRWMKQRVDGTVSGPEREPEPVRMWNEPTEVAYEPIGRWDEVERI